jgi:energy-coupling factor transport system ATP-binding protein
VADTPLVVAARGIGVRFPGGARDVVRDVSLAMGAGERIGVVGPSGCGKSTFAHVLAGAIPALIPATLRGEVTWSHPVPAGSFAAGSGRAAFVQQDVESQLVALTVAGEIAFALENRRRPPEEIDRAIANALGAGPARGLDPDRETLQLSTGWRQRLALAAALAEGAPLTILDEPTAHLDEAAAGAAIAFLTERAPGALLLVEHRADLVAPRADRLLVLDRGGSPLALAHPAAALDAVAARPDLGLRLPPTARAALVLRRHGVAVANGLAADAANLRSGLEAAPDPDALRAELTEVLMPRNARSNPGPAVLSLDGVSLARGGRSVLNDVSLAIGAGEVVGLAGGNGAGKTSLCLAAAGALRPSAGRRAVRAGTSTRMVPQNPSLVFASSSLALEARRRALAWDDAQRSLAAFGLEPDPGRHPLHHSRGELRRVALALSLAGDDPCLAILDEPTAGLDAHGLAALEARLEALRRRGDGVLVASHDTDWLARVCNRLHVLEAGRIAASGTPAEVCAAALTRRVPLAPPPALALAANLGLVPPR